jgi:hypothetical protein
MVEKDYFEFFKWAFGKPLAKKLRDTPNAIKGSHIVSAWNKKHGKKLKLGLDGGMKEDTEKMWELYYQENNVTIA